MDRCPCGQPTPYEDCCGACHRGQPAATALALMRSRFTAYVVGDEAHLRRTWHPETRPARVRIDPGQEWLALRILNTTNGGMFDREGTVEFRAEYRVAGRVDAMQENSRFVRDGGQWVYVGPVTRAD